MLMCRAGGMSFCIPATQLVGVYQISREEMGPNVKTVTTPNGVMPVISMQQQLATHLGIDTGNDDNARSLVAIKTDGVVVAFRLDQVSRPVAVQSGDWHRLPQIAHVNDPQGVLCAVVKVAQDSDDAAIALSWVIDPQRIAALAGVTASDSADDALNPRSESQVEASSITMSNQIVPQRRGAGQRGGGQLLAFVPEDIPRKGIDFIFSLPLVAVAEILNHQTRLLPLVPCRWFGGYVRWRDLPVPIINLGTCFGYDVDRSKIRRRSEGRRLVIARTSGHRYLAFYTQKQMHSMKVPESAAIKVDAFESRPCLGAFRTDYGTMLVPDLAKILDFQFSTTSF